MRACLALVLVLAVSPSLAQEAPDAGVAPAAPTPAPSPSPVEAWVAQVEALHPRRDEPAVSAQLDAAVEAGLKSHPESYDVLWRAARQIYWVAEAQTKAEERTKQGKRAWEIADKARKLNPERPEGHYYAALGIGAYSQGLGIVAALFQGVEGQYNDRLDKVIREAPDLEFGGPLIAKGRYFYELPWPKRDLRRSAELFRQVIEKRPYVLRAHFYLAETLLADGKPKEAMESLQKVLGGSAEYDPPECRRTIAWAKALEPKIQERLK